MVKTVQLMHFGDCVAIGCSGNYKCFFIHNHQSPCFLVCGSWPQGHLTRDSFHGPSRELRPHISFSYHGLASKSFAAVEDRSLVVKVGLLFPDRNPQQVYAQSSWGMKLLCNTFLFQVGCNISLCVHNSQNYLHTTRTLLSPLLTFGWKMISSQ